MATYRQKRLVLGVILSICGGFALYGAFFGVPGLGEADLGIEQHENSSSNVGKENALRVAPDFELSDVKGEKISLKAFKGRAVILHFWASWCPPCLGELPLWAELGTRLRNKQVELIAISLDRSWEDAEKILPSKNLTSRVHSLLDLSGKSAEDYGSYQFPETYILVPDSNGVHHIRHKLVGPQNWSSEAFEKMF